MYKFIFLLAVLTAPILSFAQVEITEIMYDAEGADTGFEWIEILNTSSNEIPIEDWYFYENEVNHGLSPDGFSSLGLGERALIVQNIDNMRSLYGSSIKLIKSSFSLNNSGETLAIHDESKESVSSTSYSSDSGAAGDGNSLQKNSSNSWITAEPTPGSENNSSNPTSTTTTDDEGSQSSTDKSNAGSTVKETLLENYYTGYIDITSQAVARDPVDVSAYIVHTKNGKNTKKIKGGSYFLNFGDGTIIDSDARIETSHIYEYPGSYTITFEYKKTDWGEDIHIKPTVVMKKKIYVHEHALAITDIDVRSSVSIENTTKLDINVEGWQLVSENQRYIFPKYSYIEKGGLLVIPVRTHLHSNIYSDTWVSLLNSEGVTVSSYTNNTEKMTRMNSTYIKPNKIILSPAVTVNKNITPGQLVVQEDRVVFSNKLQTASVSDTSSVEKIPLGATAGVGIVAMFLAGLRFFHKKNEKVEGQDDLDDVIGEIELIE